MDYLAKADAKEVIQKNNIKRYQIMIYYELGYINELYSFIDATKHFISNDYKSSEVVKEALFNFISIVCRLISYKENPSGIKDRAELAALRNEVEKIQTPNKLWLLEKVAEIADID